MRLHYKGKFNGDPASLPHGEHRPGAVKFREAEDPKALAVIANVAGAVLMVLLGALAVVRCGGPLTFFGGPWAFAGCVCSLLTLFPHELLHAVCFRGDVYLYTNWAQGMLFVVGPEEMSKGRFIFMSLLPNLVFGALPYAVGMLTLAPFPLALGALAVGMGAGDYYNVFHALTQMPRGARTYLYQFNSFWFLPEGEKERG